jgi:hypothetical protein
MAGRALGWAMLAYGIAGLVLVVLGAIGGLEMAGRVESLAVQADTTLAAAEDATRATADSFTGVDDSLAEGEASTDAAAILARDASATLGSLASAMSISILGARPLEPLAADFAASATQASALADTLDGVGRSLSSTREDMTRIGEELDHLATELGELRDASGTDGNAPPVRLFVAIVLAWLGLQALAALMAGSALLRRERRAPAA